MRSKFILPVTFEKTKEYLSVSKVKECKYSAWVSDIAKIKQCVRVVLDSLVSTITNTSRVRRRSHLRLQGKSGRYLF